MSQDATRRVDREWHPVKRRRPPALVRFYPHRDGSFRYVTLGGHTTLGLSRSQLYRRAKRYGINVADYRP